MDLRHGDLFHDLRNHVIRGDAFGVGFVTQHDPVPENIMSNGANIIRCHMIAAFDPGMGPGTFIQGQRTARTGADFDPGLELIAVAFRLASGTDQLHDILFNIFSKYE